MNISIIELFSSLLSFIIVSMASLFNNLVITEQVINVHNVVQNKSLSVINTVVEYDTVVRYSLNIPSNITNELVEGVDGLVYQTESGTTVKKLKDKIDQVLEIGTGKYGEYSGVVLTGYGPDCATCDGRGILFCPTKEGTWFSLNTDGVYYTDETYGKLRIIAADQREFPCGTIVEISSPKFEKTLGIVLDTGSAMKNAYNNGYLLLDLAFSSEKDLNFATQQNTNVSVKRWGW